MDKQLLEMLEKLISDERSNNKSRNDYANTKDILNKWEEYREKIASDELKLEEYTNRIEQGNEYLTHFLNISSRVFGRSREGNTKQLMIQLNSDYKTYYLEHREGVSTKEKATKSEANEYYQNYILPLLKKIISLKSINEISDFENNDKDFKDFVCKQMLRKILVLESLRNDCTSDFKNRLPHIFKKGAIDFLVNYFKIYKLDLSSYSEKGYHIICECFDSLGISNPTNEDIFYLSKVLWSIYANRDLTSKEEPNIILYGAPGTGKTYEVLKNIKINVNNDKNRYVYIQCHPGFGYEDFIEGIKPIGVTSTGSIQFSIVNGLFKELCIRAKNDLEHTYYFIADEINRTDISTMFGETLSMIEPSYRDNPDAPRDSENRHLVSTQLSNLIAEYIKQGKIEKDKYAYDYDEEKNRVSFGIPKNVRFIGMMNDVDKSIDTFDLALRRRFAWERRDYDSEVILNYLLDKGYHDKPVQDYIDRCNRLNDYIAYSKNKGLGLGVNYKLGHSYFLKIELFNTPNKNHFSGLDNLFEKYLSFILKEYIRSFKEEDEIEEYLKAAKKIFCE